MGRERRSSRSLWTVAGSPTPTARRPNPHVYVRSLTGPPGRWQITTKPGINPIWTRDGRELIYETWDGDLMSVEIETRDGFRAGTPRRLFKLPSRSFTLEIRSWGVDADGERFYVIVPPHGSSAGIVEVVTSFESLVSPK